jgi:hypothetical protein
MIDFGPYRSKEKTFLELVGHYTAAELKQLTNEMIDLQLELIADSTDDDVVFTPVDPAANDTYAANPEDINIAWTLGHLIVHTTASSEESAALAAEFARGVPHRGGRSRAEVPWDSVTTIAQCRERLEESRRMRLASLDMWPDKVDTTNGYVPWESMGHVNASARFCLGFSHDDSHLEQIREVVRQAKAARA